MKDPNFALKMLVYGPPGAGKTVFLSTVLEEPSMLPALMLDLEAGTMSIRSKCAYVDFTNIAKPTQDKLNVLRVARWDDLVKVYDLLWDGSLAYKTVLIDSLSEINQMNLTHVATKGSMQRPSLKNPAVPEIRDYLISNTTMMEFLRGLRDLSGVHVIATALQEAEKTEEDMVIQIQPLLSGKLSRRVMGIFDIVGYMSIDAATRKRVLSCQPTAKIIAKDRTEGGKLGAKIENPTFAKVLELANA